MGAPLHATVTARLYPPSGMRLSAYTALAPGETVADENEPDAGPIVEIRTRSRECDTLWTAVSIIGDQNGTRDRPARARLNAHI